MKGSLMCLTCLTATALGVPFGGTLASSHPPVSVPETLAPPVPETPALVGLGSAGVRKHQPRLCDFRRMPTSRR